MAISQNVGITVARPGSANIPVTIGCITLAICAISAIAAFTARETYRLHVQDLGNRDSVPVPKVEYDRARAQTLAVGLG